MIKGHCLSLSLSHTHTHNENSFWGGELWQCKNTFLSYKIKLTRAEKAKRRKQIFQVIQNSPSKYTFVEAFLGNPCKFWFWQKDPRHGPKFADSNHDWLCGIFRVSKSVHASHSLIWKQGKLIRYIILGTIQENGGCRSFHLGSRKLTGIALCPFPTMCIHCERP